MVIEALRASQKVYLSSCRTSTNMFKHRFFHLKKNFFFENSGSDKGQKYFFWSFQLLRNFLWRSRNCIYWRYRLSQIWGRTLSYIFLGFWGHHSVFRPFFRHREAKMGQKKWKQTKSWKKILTRKNLRALAIFQKKNLSCPTKSHWDILKNFWLFFLSPHGSWNTRIFWNQVYLYFILFCKGIRF